MYEIVTYIAEHFGEMSFGEVITMSMVYVMGELGNKPATDISDEDLMEFTLRLSMLQGAAEGYAASHS